MVKRLFDILVSAAAMVLLAPLFLILALMVKVASPGPIFYRATRIGRNGEPFKLYKFRSMVMGADQQGPGITTADDNRVTPIGRLLRRTKLDELPQLLNVFKGDMSIVGPRPEDPRYVALYTPQQRMVLEVRPGITSLASLRYRNEEILLAGENWESVYVSRIMPEKLAIDLAYIQRASLGQDIGIILRTVGALFR